LRVYFLIIKGELDEIVAKDAAMRMNSSNVDAVNENLSPEMPAERAMGLS